MSGKLKYSLQVAVSFLFAAIFLYLAFRGTDFDALWNSLRYADYLLVLLLLPIHVLSHYVRAVRWGYLLSPVKERMKKEHLFSAVMIGYMVNYALPRVGELVRCYVVGKLEGVSKSSVLGSVVIERILDLVAMFLTISIVLLIYPSTLYPFFGEGSNMHLVLFAGALLMFAVLLLVFLKSEMLFSMFRHIMPVVPGRFRPRVEQILNSFISGLAIARMKEKFLQITLLSILISFLYAAGFYGGFFLFESIRSAHLDFGAGAVLLVVSSIAFVLPAPGGIGTYHTFIKKALVVLFGVDEVSALSYTIVTHELGMVIVVAIGIGFFLKEQLHVADLRDSGEEKERKA